MHQSSEPNERLPESAAGYEKILERLRGVGDRMRETIENAEAEFDRSSGGLLDGDSRR